MINFITELVLIEKEHLLGFFDNITTPQNTLISSNAHPVRINFAWRNCQWYSDFKKTINGDISSNTLGFSFSKKDLLIKKWMIDNLQKDFVGFVKLRNNTTYIIGNKNVGLSLRFQQELNIKNNFIVFISGLIDTEPVVSEYNISDFFVGRDFSDDFNIGFG